MTTAQNGNAISLTYTVSTNAGLVVGGTGEGEPMVLNLGKGEIFAEIEDGVRGMEIGDQKIIKIPSDSAFGPHRPELVIEVPRSHLNEGEIPKPGLQMMAKAENGDEFPMTIVEVTDDKVVADGNHPLAGQDLNFDLTIVSIDTTA